MNIVLIDWNEPSQCYVFSYKKLFGQLRIIGHCFFSSFMQYILSFSSFCHQAPDERNYHIFYQLCSAASDKKYSHLRLGKSNMVTNYYLWRCSTCSFTPRSDVHPCAPAAKNSNTVLLEVRLKIFRYPGSCLAHYSKSLLMCNSFFFSSKNQNYLNVCFRLEFAAFIYGCLQSRIQVVECLNWQNSC